jgi:predicted nucleic acid-binding Zn ribbon protein
MKKVGPLIENLLKSHGLWQGYQQHMLIESWNDLVGNSLAEVTKAEKITNGVFRVLVKDSVWAYHLSMLKPQLIKKLNDFSGRKIVRDINFSIADFDCRKDRKDG